MNFFRNCFQKKKEFLNLNPENVNQKVLMYFFTYHDTVTLNKTLKHEFL